MFLIRILSLDDARDSLRLRHQPGFEQPISSVRKHTLRRKLSIRYFRTCVTGRMERSTWNPHFEDSGRFYSASLRAAA